LVALLAAPALGAQGRWEDSDRRDDRDRWETRGSEKRDERRLFVWRGVVDDDTRIHMRGDRVRTQVVSGTQRRSNGRVVEMNNLPRRDGIVRVELLEGRGRVHVIQQPNVNNDYTAIVRVKDGQGGAGQYRFAVYFDPADNGRRVGRGGVWDTVGGDVYSGASVFRWSGSVDGDLRIALRRGQVGYDVVSGEYPRNVNSTVLANQVARRDRQLGVSLRQGRGSVTVLQQPSEHNNYTAIIRVVDYQGGYGFYDFDLVWR
jgi:hypothetical protein